MLIALIDKGEVIIKDIHYITDLEQLKALSDPLRVNIITALGTGKKNSQQLAKILKIPRTRVHYHLNLLEKMGIIKVVDTDLVNGIVQKYYYPTARAFVPSPNIFQKLFSEDTIECIIDKDKLDDFLKEYHGLTEKYFTEKQENTNTVVLSLLKI